MKPRIRWKTLNEDTVQLIAVEGSWYYDRLISQGEYDDVLDDGRKVFIHEFKQSSGHIIFWDRRFPDNKDYARRKFDRHGEAIHLPADLTIQSLLKLLKHQLSLCYNSVREKSKPPAPAKSSLLEGVHIYDDDESPPDWQSPRTEPTYADHGDTPYRKVDAINQSGLKQILKSPMHYWHNYRNPDKPVEAPKASLQFGTALDALVLDGEVKHAVQPVEINRRTKAGREAYELWQAELPAGTVILKQEESDKLEDMAESLMNHAHAGDLIQASSKATLFWDWIHPEPLGAFIHEPNRIVCKGEADGLLMRDDRIELIDLKTTVDASPDGFSREIAKYSYHIQAAFYTDGAWANHDVDLQNIRFTFIAIEKSPPYAIGVYQLANLFIEQGRRQYEEALHIYEKCLYAESQGEGEPWSSYKRGYKMGLPVYAWDAETREYMMG